MAGGWQGGDVERLVRSQGGLLTTARARSCGWSRSMVRAAVAAGDLRRLRQGVYTSARHWERAGIMDRHRLVLRAHQLVNPSLAGRGLSAAAALGLPLPDRGQIRAQLPGRELPGRELPGTELPSRELPDAELPGTEQLLARPCLRPARPGESLIRLTADGPLLTEPARIVIDCARVLPAEWGLAVADAAIASGWLKVSDLQPVDHCAPVEGANGPRGIRRARWVLGRARAEVESPLESIARAVVVLGGFPEPVPQRWISTAAGSFRADLLDEASGVIIEADGKLKYADPDALWREKRREDALRDAGHDVIRFVMADYFHPAPWCARYRTIRERHL